MTRERAFAQVDVFATDGYDGNPVAVVLDGSDLTADSMAAFTRWTNLSEATFLMPPTDSRADYRVRIFTPGGEVPFAGHPTLGSCHAFLQAHPEHNGPMVVQECGVGLVTIRRDAEQLAFAAPPLIRSGPVDDATLSQAIAALGLSRGAVRAARWIDNGPGWLGLMLTDAATVLAIKPNAAALAQLKVGVIGPSPAAGIDFEVRAFAPALSILEDPVTGSLNAGFATWLIPAGLAPERYVVRQGSALHRNGRVHIVRADDAMWVGGRCASCIVGTVRL